MYYTSASVTLVTWLAQLFYSASFGKIMKVGASVVVVRWGRLSRHIR